MMSRRIRLSDGIGYAFVYAMTAAAFIPVIAFLVYVLAKGIGRVNWEFLSSASSSMESGGIFAPLFGTLVLTLLSVAAGRALVVAELLERAEQDHPAARQFE